MDEECKRIIDEARATVERLDWNLRPRDNAPDWGDAFDANAKWAREGRELERAQQRAKRLMRQKKEADDMARARTQASAPDDLDQRIAVAIEAALKIERKNNRRIWAQVLAELQSTVSKRLDASIMAVDGLATRVTELSKGGADAVGVVRKQIITPH
jgi:hypothetical protein